ncbi:transglycosylase domain-containing protein [Microbacterium sp.]|uniref:transglycosylase domain-containing protein n=1 Tax=Microbacterium sp. TaxID=51671 RepID=UPI0039187D18
MPENKRTASGALGGIVGLVGLSAVAGLLVTAAVTPAIAVSGAAASSAITIFDKMPSYLQPDELMQPTTLMAGDQVLAKFFDQNRSPVTFDQVSPVMYDAILSSEDPRYYQHGGVDLIGTTRALLSNASGGETQGGSSISQQYVKNVLVQRCERDAKAVEKTDTDPGMSRDEALQKCALEAIQADGVEGYQRKLQEMRYAIQLEKEFTKDQILLGYLNIANFGGVTYGIDAAAKRYFNVPASQLNIGQSAVLAGMVQNPNRFRIDQAEGSIFDNDGTAYNKAPDGSIDDVDQGTIQALYTLRDNGEITQDQLVAAADGYSETKGRQLYVLSRMEADGKITHEQYVQFAVEPITPQITSTDQGCAASSAPYFCQYVVSTILNDPAFGAGTDDRVRALRQDGLTIQTTLDWRVQDAAQNAMSEYAPQSYDGIKFGSTAVNVESKTGRVLAIAQNTKFTQDASLAQTDPTYNSVVFAGDSNNGGSIGFSAGSTFKLFTLVDWLEKGHSLNETLNGRLGPVPSMTNSCTGNYVNTSRTVINNFNNDRGYVGTPLRFTRDSLNTGYLQMASELDLCDIAKTAAKLGVTRGDGSPIEMKYPNNVIGDDNVSPIAMAAAYATVANGGTLCQPKVIDKVTASDGSERAIPERTCSPALSPEVAATAAYALQGVMAGGGTGSRANPGDGTPMLGKTGTHEGHETWMIESSTNTTTAVWVGNYNGTVDLFRKYFNGLQLADIRYPLARDIQSASNDFYGGDRFPDPASNLLRTQQRDLPDVVGDSIDSARSTLEGLGFRVSVGDPVDSELGGDKVAAQNPGAGSAPAGSSITLNPGNGKGGTVPDVIGRTLSAAQNDLKAAGFENVAIGPCKESDKAPDGGQVTATEPAARTATSKSTPVTLSLSAKDCP